MNTRNSSYGRYPARYNNTGTFVPAVTTNVQPVQTTYSQQSKPQPPQTQQQSQPAAQNPWKTDTQEQQNYAMQQQQQQQDIVDEFMKAEQGDEGNGDLLLDGSGDGGEEAGSGGRMKWMKKGFKLSMRERRRRQNRQLRKLLTPKNALTVLNELTPGHQHECTVVPEQEQYGGSLNKQYVAVLNVGGIEYRGTGLSKLLAKNNAAEQVIRDVMIKQMAKLPEVTAQTEETKMDTTEGEPTTEPSFPMMQLASYALHKLFTDWQQEGFKVPNLGPVKPPSGNISDKESVSSIGTTPSTKKAARKTPVLPSNAVHLHPCMLLSQMRSDATYNFLSVEGIKPNSQIFTMGVNVDGTTYVGKAQNKKEARRLAAKKACETIFNLVYPDDGNVSIEDM